MFGVFYHIFFSQQYAIIVIASLNRFSSKDDKEKQDLDKKPEEQNLVAPLSMAELTSSISDLNSELDIVSILSSLYQTYQYCHMESRRVEMQRHARSHGSYIVYNIE